MKQTKDYLLLIDEEAEIKEGDYQLAPMIEKIELVNSTNLHLSYMCYKIIAYYPLTKEAKELDLPWLPNPFKEENDIETLACNIYNLSLDEYEYINEDLSQNRSLIEEHYKDINRKEIAERYFDVISFIAGYNAAQSKQFSLEDLKKAFEAGEEYTATEFLSERSPNLEQYIQSLSTQQLPKEFIPEYKKVYIKYDKDVADFEGDGFIGESDELRTITNSEGKEVIQGEWIY